ncbi:MAG TPA: TetR/AcrR family transcriptional regulator [Actinophytocola sp.]|uniref:TetR/AcrR family transcriptional regulator n=1 Tax=Actinophytocola sp. TaxID=1872138 RepID=UPI002DBBF0C3|nr:TetR/AcrR family transcriptional regulator [Actinophytocola sp.]HEU5475243.1 TetR/AcrR family transcriptional regulator [Actinophytocola sp.]
MAVKKTAGSIRARVRAEMIEEIKAVARRQIATEGAALSLRAVSRELGMVSSALYRYFDNRDDLLTALIIDAYNALGEAAESADAAVADRSDLLGRWRAVTTALRAWSLDRPHEYALIYGSPVPGYAAPEDTVPPATRPVLVLGAILADAKAAGRLVEADPDTPVPDALRAEIAGIADLIGAGVDVPTMARGLVAWTQIFGAINFELFGRIDNTIDARDDWFAYQVRAMAEFIGLRD